MNRKYIPLILCPLLLTACGQDNRLPRSPEELEEYAESIAQENTTETEMPTTALFEYNSHGDVKRKYYIEDGICYVDTPYKNQYDEDGRLVKQTEGDGYLGMETEYFYGAQGNVIREIARSTYLDEQFYDTVYGYDEAGRRLEVTCD